VVQRQRRHRGEQLDVNIERRSKGLSPTCANGRLLPEVYLLGSSKCATTELATELMDSGLVSAAAVSTAGPMFPGFDKEFHYFFRWWRSANYTIDVETLGRDLLESMPACSESLVGGQRMITGDYTPNHLALVPPGDGYRLTGATYPNDNEMGAIDLAHTLHSIYSNYLGAATNRVRFIVNMREPLSRMQSAWYQHLSGNSIMGIPFIMQANFSEDLRLAVDGFEQGEISLLMWYSLQGRQLQQYLAVWESGQFFLQPYRYYVNLAKAEVCDELSHFLAYPVTCSEVVPVNEAAMHHSHPSIEDDAAPDLIERFQQLVAAENKLLVQQLTMAHQQGATLAHFAGSPSIAAVEEWLTGGW